MKPLLLALFTVVALLAATGSAQADDSGTVGATIFVDPLAATLTIKPASIPIQHQANARATIVNNGPAPLRSTTATLLIDPLAVSVAGGLTRIVPALAANSSVEVSWRLCGVRAGSYLAMARITSSDSLGHQFETETAAVLLEVTPRRRGNSSC